MSVSVITIKILPCWTECNVTLKNGGDCFFKQYLHFCIITEFYVTLVTYALLNHCDLIKL